MFLDHINLKRSFCNDKMLNIYNRPQVLSSKASHCKIRFDMWLGIVVGIVDFSVFSVDVLFCLSCYIKFEQNFDAKCTYFSFFCI